jgi:hypothetical protein
LGLFDRKGDRYYWLADRALDVSLYGSWVGAAFSANSQDLRALRLVGNQ